MMSKYIPALMLKDYIQAVFRTASFDNHADGDVYGEVTRFDASAKAPTQESCEVELLSVLEEGIMTCLEQGIQLPEVNKLNLDNIELVDEEELTSYLVLMESLPPIPEWYTPDSEAVKAELEKQRTNWRERAAWLKHFLQGEPEPNWHENSFVLDNYPAARLSAECLNLIYAARWRSPLLQKMGTTAQIWICCEISDALREYKDSGLKSLVETGQAKPNLIGKRSQLDKNSQALWHTDLINREPSELRDFTSLDSPEQLDYEYRNFVLGQAELIARDDQDFRDNIFSAYNTLAQKTNGLWRKSKNHQITAILPDGFRFIGGKTRNRGMSKKNIKKN